MTKWLNVKWIEKQFSQTSFIAVVVGYSENDLEALYLVAAGRIRVNGTL